MLKMKFGLINIKMYYKIEEPVNMHSGVDMFSLKHVTIKTTHCIKATMLF